MSTLAEESVQLRKVARMYMDGELSQEEYRRQRRAVINAWAGEEFSVSPEKPADLFSDQEEDEITQRNYKKPSTPAGQEQAGNQAAESASAGEDEEDITLFKPGSKSVSQQESGPDSKKWLWIVPVVLGVVGLLGLGSLLFWIMNK